jgi:hypothetical protein
MADKSSKKVTTKKKPVAAPKRTASTAKKQTFHKPIFSTGTIVTLVTFVLVIAVAVFINQKKEADAAAATPTAETSFVFTAADGTPSGIKIEPAQGDAVELQRDDKNAWGLTLPLKAEANQSMAEAAATQLTSISIVNPKIDGNTADFGLDTPSYVITVTFAGGKTHILEIGDSAVTNNGYYARLDKGDIMLVSLSGIDALTQMTFSPPYLNTPTPTALPPTMTPVPVSETPASSTDVTVTPTP